MDGVLLVVGCGQFRQGFGGAQDLFVADVAYDVSVAQGYVAAAVTGDFGVVRHEDNRASLGVELLEEYQYFEAGAGSPSLRPRE